jgi:inosose dehydratase
MYKPKFAYAIWSWGLDNKEQMVQAIKDIKEVGFFAFESVKNTIDLFRNNAAEFKAITEEHGVYPVSFYFYLSGNESKDIEDVESKMGFLQANNVHRMSLQAPGKKGGATKEELSNLLKTTEKIGRIAKKYDVVPCFHPHEGTMVMYENEIDFIMQNTDPEYISMGPDTAHLVLGKCDPVEIFKRYINRIKFVHLKDIMKDTEIETGADASKGFDVYSAFVELGNGNVDFKSVFKMLEENKYDGYMAVELDKTRYTHKESALISMKYLKTRQN